MANECTAGKHTGYKFESEERDIVRGKEVVQHVYRCECGATVQVKKV